MWGLRPLVDSPVCNLNLGLDGELMDWPFPTDLDMKSKDPKVKLKTLCYERLPSENFDLSNLMANILSVEAVADLHRIRVCHSFIHQSSEKQDWLSNRVDGLLGSKPHCPTDRRLCLDQGDRRSAAHPQEDGPFAKE